MDFKRNGKLMNEAVKAGCRTMAELALYLRVIRNPVGSIYRPHLTYGIDGR